jgi:undecaprenyl-phosphate 4-deoxy-4-formamido-L-arabinose transferase
MPLVSFVIPCYRSEHTIHGVADELRRAMEALPGYEYELILVNDCSPDGTFAVLREMAESDEHVTAVDLAKNFGQHAALMAGLRHAAGEIVVCLDDDGQTPGDEAGKLIRKLEEGYDVVYASYEHKQHSAFRNFGTVLNNRMTEIMLGKPRELTITSYFAMRRFIVDEMLVYKNCYPYVEGLILRATRKIGTVPVTHRAREEGESGYTLVKLVSLWMNGFTSFSVKPLRIATWCGGLAAALGFVYFIVILVKHFVDSSIPEGWASTMALMLVLGGVILLVLGMIGEYIGRIYMCINASPQYVERQVIRKR